MSLSLQKNIITPSSKGAVGPLSIGCRCIIRYEARINDENGELLDDGGQNQIAFSLPPLPPVSSSTSSTSSSVQSYSKNNSFLLPGLVYGLHSMKVGETSSFILPPDQAFGENGRPASAFISEDDSLSARVGKAFFREKNTDTSLSVSSGRSIWFKITLLSCDTGPALEEFDWDLMAQNNKEDGNKLLINRDAKRAIAAYDQAIACLDKAQKTTAHSTDIQDETVRSIARSEQRVILHSNKAQAFLMLDKFAEAEMSCTTGLLLDITHLKSLFRRARAYRGLGKLSEARVDARNLYSLNPGNLEARKLMLDLGLSDEINSKIDKENNNEKEMTTQTINNTSKDESKEVTNVILKNSMLNPDEDFSQSIAETTSSLRHRGSTIKSANISSTSNENSFAKALKKGLTDGLLYEDKPDIDMDAFLKEAKSTDNMNKNKDKENNNNILIWIYQSFNSCLASLGCARKRKRLA